MTAAGPVWGDVAGMIDGILSRRYYTNHGPLAQQLEYLLCIHHGARHAVAVTNPAIGLTMMLEAANLSGRVMLSALAPPRCAQAVAWAGLAPSFCDVDACFRFSVCAMDDAGGGGGGVLLAPDYDGSDAETLRRVETRALHIVVDGVTGPRTHWGTHPALATLPGLPHGPSSACILSDDDGYAARLRNIRSSYGAGPPVPVRRTANGRMSEAQAGLALLHLAEVETVHATPTAARPAIRRYGQGLALTLEGPDRRDTVLAGLQASGWRAIRPPQLPPGARHCRNAADFIACSILMPSGTGAEAALVESLAGADIAVGGA